jgi:hypothetical protein
MYLKYLSSVYNEWEYRKFFMASVKYFVLWVRSFIEAGKLLNALIPA